MCSYSEKDIPLISLGIQLKALSEDQLRLALGFVDESTRELIMKILTEEK